MHEAALSCVSIYVTRLILCVCLGTLTGLTASAFAAPDDDLDRMLKGVQERYNHAKTLQVSFNETYTVQGRPRQTESGTLTLRKPGRMRWDYSAPAGKLFVSDGKRRLSIYTPEGKRVEKMKLKESEDMRAPLAFLLGKLDFKKEFRDFDMNPEGANFVITAKAKSDKLPYEDIRLTAAQDFTITNLVITGQDQSVLTFQPSRPRS